MSMKTKWPDEPDTFFADECFMPVAQEKIRYERARAEAAIERLRYAKEMLRQIADIDASSRDFRQVAWEALFEIGALPDAEDR